MGIFINDDQHVTLLCDLRITPSQLFLLYLVHTRSWVALDKFNRITGGIPYAEYKDLIKRGIIIDMNKDGEQFMDNCFVNDEIATKLFVEINQAGQELWEKYPNYIYVNGAQVPTKSTDKDDALKKYMDKIACNPVRHKRVMELLQYAVTNGLITMGIEKWLSSSQWEVLEQEHGFRLGGENNESETFGEREI